MAVAYDNGTANGTQSYSHTVTGSNTFLVLFVLTSSTTAPSATYNGVSMTYGNIQARNGNGAWIHWLYLTNPATGSNTVSITAGNYYNSVALSYTGVKQTGQPEANASTASSSTTVTTTTNNAFVVVGYTASGTPGAGQSNWITRASGGGTYCGDSNGPVSPAGAYTVQTTTNGDDALIALSIAPAAVATTNAAFLLNFV